MLHKKVMLALVAFALAIGAFVILSRGDRSQTPAQRPEAGEALRKFVSMPPSSQPGRVIQDGDIPFSPGDHTLARIYDDITGRLKYQFEAKTWKPISETDFHLEELLIQIFMPHGEITYISADEAQVTLARKSKNRVDPKSGWVRGNVKVTIDRTTSEWRSANPELADRYAHPNDLINIDLQDAKFDMERAELVADGPLLVDSSDVRIEDVSGLTLQWDQVDNRIDVLRFKQGGKMTLRRGGKMVDFAMPGTQRDAVDSASPAEPAEVAEAAAPPTERPVGVVSANEVPGASVDDRPQHALAMKPMAIKTVSADQAAAEIRLDGGSVKANRGKALPADQQPTSGPDQAYKMRSPDALATATKDLMDEARAGASGVALDAKDIGATVAPKRRKIHTYRAVFSEQVVVEQKDGLRTIGKLEASKLELNFDFGDKQKSLTGARSSEKSPPTASAPAGQGDAAAPDEAASPEAPSPSTPSPAAKPSLDDDRTKLVLSWNGPLDLRPLQVEPAEQTGQRFDAIATGSPVRVQSEQGNAVCDQLVYRHERRQAWLAGTESAPVELSVNESRKLLGRQVFFDQKRGLAVVDGAGMMTDDRKENAKGKGGGSLVDSIAGPASGDAKSGGKKRGPVEIRWARGVELELGFRPVERINASTGLKEKKQREFLQRAWFHGDVSVKQGDDRIAAQEIAITFGHPVSKEEVADHIQHLNMIGDVHLERGKEYITAERLDAEMIVTPNRRNVPRIVDAEGKVRVKQGDREIRAETMHVVLAEAAAAPAKKKQAGNTVTAFGDSRLGVESLDAQGNVYVHDAARNLRIRKAETLKCQMRDANQLLNATITGAAPDAFARVRFGDTAIHGHNIAIQMEDESVDVPGPGQAWMVTQQDFTGRKLRKPAPVKISWIDSMQFRLARNVGWFAGKVHCESQTFSLDSDKLVIRFGKAPPVQETRKEGIVERFYLLGEIVGDKAQLKEVAPTPLAAERKKPVYISAEGNAQAISAEYAPNSPEGQPGRLRSRLWISGDSIVADLTREQLSVASKGSLLIEDYQFSTPQEQASLARKAATGNSPLMSTMRDEGPSQTAVTWENSMDFFLDRGLVAFDKNVSMIHRSGQELVLQEELSAAMRIDAEQLQQMDKGRKAMLSCGHLLLEFLTREPSKSAQDSTAPTIRATDLKRLIAKQAVHLQESTKSLMGDYLQYTQETNEVRLEGSAGLEARIIDQDEKDQRLTMWRGPLLVWDRRTNRIEAPGATIRASRR